MARKVVAIYMHEDEREAARSLMAGANISESFVYGEADDAAIDRMRAMGLIVVPQGDQEESSDVMGFAPSPLAAMQPRPAGGPPFAPAPARPGWYLVTLDGPLMEAWKDQLAGLRVRLRDS